MIAQNVTLSNIKCTISNSTNKNRNVIYNSIGGCIRTNDIYFRNFENIHIFNSFSDKTSFGIIILDKQTKQIFANNTLMFPNTSKVCFFF